MTMCLLLLDAWIYSPLKPTFMAMAQKFKMLLKALLGVHFIYYPEFNAYFRLYLLKK